MTLKRSKEKLSTYPDAEQAILSLQQEYDLLISKINDFYQVKKELLAVKRARVFAEVEKSDLMTQYKELNQHLKIQRHRWQTITVKLA